MEDIVKGHAASFKIEVSLLLKRAYPPAINHVEQAAFAIKVAENCR